MRKGSHVAVMLPNIAALPLTWLAIGMLGAVMVPMNNTYSEREIAYVLEDSDARFMVVDEACLGPVEAVRAAGKVDIPADRLIVVGGGTARYRSLDELMAGATDGFVPAQVGHDDLLNIQYTSGTTGFPKGCMLTQRYWLTAGKVNAVRDGSLPAGSGIDAVLLHGSAVAAADGDVSPGHAFGGAAPKHQPI